MNNTDLKSFLVAGRRRLWIEQVIVEARKLVWLVSIVLLVFAVVHLLIMPLNLWVALIIALISGLLALIPMLSPGADFVATAMRADRLFDGNSLLTTAEECLRDPGGQQKAAQKIVLQQAESAARSWRPMLGSIWQPPGVTGFALAVIPFFIALLLLSLPGADRNSSTINSRSNTLLSTDRNDSERDDVAQLRETLTLEAAGELQGALPATSAEEILQPGARDTDVPLADAGAYPHPNESTPLNTPNETTLLPTSSMSAPGFASAEVSTENRPGDAKARRKPVGSVQDGSDPDFQSVRLMELQRNGDVVSTNMGGDDYSGDTDINASRQASRVRPASPPESRPYWTILDPATAAYARNYLSQISETNE